MKRMLFIFLVLALGGIVAACQQTPTPTPSAGAGKPNVIIITPLSNATVQAGDEVQVRSTSSDAEGIVLVELLVDGQPVQNSPTPNGAPQSQFSVIQTWTAITTGSHTLTVRATNARLGTGEASITLNVAQTVAQATATLVINDTPIPTATPLVNTATPAPPPATSAPTTCTLASAFIADVTIPDGTVIAPGATFVKTWAIQNTGTCTWGGGYNAVFVGGETFSASSPQPISPANPGDVINISITMVAPTTPGQRSSVWQLQASNGILFGTKFDVVINIPGAPTPRPPTAIPPTPIPPVGCNGTPIFAGFVATPPTINAGQVSTLSWGVVQNASAVFLTSPGGTQGVGTPGSLQVQPSQTTTYTLTAYCNNVPAQIQVTVNVNGGGGGCNGTPRFNGFYANPQTITSGQQTTLNWGLVQNANAVFLQLSDKSEGVASPGSRSVKPKQTTTYTLVAYCGNNQASVSTTVNVNGGCSGKPQFNGFSANPSTIQKGQSSLLSWGFVANATSVVLKTPDGNSGVATPGQIYVSPQASTTYTLIAYCNNTSNQLAVNVKVNNPAPTPTPTPEGQNTLSEVQVQKNGKNKWKVTVKYYWNGQDAPAYVEGVGTGKGGAPATNTDSRSLIAGFVKYAILELKNSGSKDPTKFTVCMVGRGDTDLVCKTVPAP